MYELSKIMRQKDDLAFAELLNRIREGKHTNADINTLRTRVCREDSRNSLMDVTHIFPVNASVDYHNKVVNASVDYHNKVVFEKCKNSKVCIKAIDIIIGDISDHLKETIRKHVPKDPSKTMGLFAVVDVAVGMKYDLTANISVLDGMTNGAEFILQKIDYGVCNSSRPSILWVLFEDYSVGTNYRAEYSHLYNEKTDKKWIPLTEITRQFKINKRSECQVLRRQFPLRPAAAKTIHRCQGDTLNEVVIELPASSRDHMHYVGLSRVRNLSSLHILNFKMS